MDIIGVINSIYRSYGTLFSDDFIAFFKENTQNHVWITILIVLFTTTILVACYLWRKNKIRKQSIIDRLTSSFLHDGQTRFRKRDKMLFYGRRMLRKVKTISTGTGAERGRKRRAVMKFARKILQLQKDNLQPQLKVTEPPAEYFEEIIEKVGEKVPADAYFMLQSIRIFGQFEKPVFLRICKHTEIINLKAGDYLIKIGDADDSVFIVQSGSVNVFLNNADGSSISLKVAKKGETVTSLLSFIDILVGNDSTYKTVTAKAIEDSQIIRLPMFALKEIFNENHDILVRVIQVIMVRLQRITISALYNYLGLNIDYIHVSQKKKQAQAANPLTNIPKGYQHKRQMSDQFSLVMSSVTSDKNDKPDMLNDIEFPILVPRRTSVLPQPTDIPIDIELMKSLATDGFLKELGLKDDDRALIVDSIEIKEIQAGVTLTHQGREDDVMLIYIITGGLNLINYQPNKGSKKVSESHSVTLHAGEVVGGLAVLTGESSLYAIKSRVSSRVGLITKENVYKIMQQRPTCVLDIANSVVKGLSPLVRQCDFALDWIFLESGRAVYRQDEASDSTYIVLNGRLRSVMTHMNGKKEVVGEYGKGDLIGIVEMITESQRSTSVMAVRDSELAKLPEGLFNAIKLKYPVVVTQLISLLGHRLLGSMRNATISSKPNVPIEASPLKHKFATIAILSITDDVPLTAFTYELYHSLSAICPTARLTADVVRKTLGMNIMESANEYRLLSYLSQQEDHNEVTLYQCESGTLTPWTQRCLRQADVILIVGLAERPPSLGKLEREIERFAIRTAKELVLLHTETSTSSNLRPTNTVQWLNQRTWVNKHHHILCPKRMFTRKSQYRVNDLYTKVLNSEPNIHSDFSRLARWLTGNSVALVLGGGGARGAAHVGMLKAIQEASIPIDMVGGVSIGAFMGALWCAERNITIVTQKAREWCKKMTQYGLQILDLTYPITSMFSGRQFNKTIRDTFGDNVKIEDLWIPYFTLTTDITDSCARIHTHGVLWRLVRSSMTIAGVFPPMCVDGHHLIDGCYTNNVPADVMRSQGANIIIAIDVGSQDDTDLTDYGDDLSGWWVLYKRYNPFTSPIKVMTLPDIQSRLAYVSCVRQLEQVKSSDYCEYLRPPIDKYKTLAFGSFDEIREVGFNYGKNYFEQLAKSGGLNRFNRWTQQKSSDESRESSPSNSQSNYTFVDLAQIVCRVPEICQERHDDLSSEDDYFVGYASEPSTLRSSAKVRQLRAVGGSLSLSENEYESDIDSSDAEPNISSKKSLNLASSEA
ncbi:hypothetical protein ACKWTF_005772 [Chironomus riparius]